jgi:heat shock protein HslJ
VTVKELFAFIPLVIVLSLVTSTAPAGQAETLSGRSWVAEDINGKGVMDMLQTTLEFGEDGKVGGNAGCNRYFGSVKIEGDKIEFGPLGATRKMCPESIMNQEDAFFKAVPEVVRWRIENGLLFLYSDGDSPILRLSEIDEK